MELHELLVRHGFTGLRLLRKKERGSFELQLRRSWDPGTDWSLFGTGFQTDSLPCSAPAIAGDSEARALIQAACVEGLAHLEALMAAGRHEMMTLDVEADLGIRAALAVHSSVLGSNNGLHALRAGGFRRHEPREEELEVFEDGLNLARAMSFKNAAADLPVGGCKLTVQCEPIALDDLRRLGFLAYVIDAGRFFTGPDMGFTPEHADALRSRFTKHAVGGRGGPLGPTGAPTARGCFLAIQEAAFTVFGSRDLSGKKAAIQGVGAVGAPLAAMLREAGASLVVADPSERALAALRERIGPFEVVAPERVLGVRCDLLAPCAGGGVLDERTIGELDCRMVYGSANNQLRAVSKEEELRLAELLEGRGVLFQIEWTHNTAGVMAGFEEYVRGEEARLEHLLPRLERTCRDGVRRILDTAKKTKKTPTAVAYEQIEQRIYPS